ncbi:DUF4293 domain-containing protein [Flammeovirgaceae bacterium SG7u.111]|nr:DUF4293 domain-containing protein [Flammeovirgaceae bacterium SG7u.132]WPO34689.1 DUF4293 domain-containing protein [Flammeovirgaceae bacterium SG7u.111]
MIQRIQTIFLALVAICMFLVIFLPIWNKTNPETSQTATLTALSLVYSDVGDSQASQTTIYIAIAAFLSSVLAVGSIFSYSNRLKQMKLNLFNTIFIAAVMGLNIYFVFEGEKLFDVEMQGAFGVAFFLPAAALLFNSMANRFIRRDENMVRSAERFR